MEDLTLKHHYKVVCKEPHEICENRNQFSTVDKISMFKIVGTFGVN